jgi:uncharacterized protein (DUF362 family)/Pyruvate/2-oxoacid:ferredoxin oxidoreductase delta subunit
MVRFMQMKGALVSVGDSPSIHLKNFLPEKSGIMDVCRRTGVPWIDFRERTTEIRLNKGTIKVASAALEADLIISLPKFKNHELVYITGAIKNTLGVVPGFIKAKQHALYQSRSSFGEFLVDLNEAILPSWFLTDGIIAMEGPGPAQGMPRKTGVLIASVNPLLVDITASKIAGYNPMLIPTTKTAFFRKRWMKDEGDISYDGPDIDSLVVPSFIKIPPASGTNISIQFVMRRIPPLRKFERRPVFIHNTCTGCLKCVKICPVNAIKPNPVKKNWIDLNDSKCIRCFCCAEVCTDNSVAIKRKVFGA